MSAIAQAQNHVCIDCARETKLAPIDERLETTNPDAAADIFTGMIGNKDREHCLAIMLDTKHRVIEVATVSIGNVDHTFMSPREILRDALLVNASAIILGHNHPSGDPDPSRDDEMVTRRIVQAGELMGIDVLDHVVVGGTRWVSLARRGMV